MKSVRSEVKYNNDYESEFQLMTREEMYYDAMLRLRLNKCIGENWEIKK